MRTLVGDGTWDWPDEPWLRVNFVASVDGSAQGSDGRSGTINNDVDVEVFHRLRRSADVILVGAGTARAEEYGPSDTPMVVVGHEMPAKLSDGLNVRLASGPLTDVVASIHGEGHRRILCEGGPTLFAGLLEARLVDEVCLTTTPCLVGGPGKRIVDATRMGAGAFDVPLTLSSLVEHDGTLLARWLVSRP